MSGEEFVTSGDDDDGAGPSTIRLSLVVRDPAGNTRQVAFERSLIKIGKQASCHLVLDETRVSRLHAILEAAPTKPLTLIDLGSESGTFVNGQRINKAELQAGDLIRIGGFRIMIAGIAVR